MPKTDYSLQELSLPLDSDIKPLQLVQDFDPAILVKALEAIRNYPFHEITCRQVTGSSVQDLELPQMVNLHGAFRKQAFG